MQSGRIEETYRVKLTLLVWLKFYGQYKDGVQMDEYT